MAIVLGCGDAFHLIPRVIAQCTGGFANNTAALGVGKFITSVTMTIFYVILYHVWRERYEVTNKNALTMSIYILAVFRIVLCLFPQNQWISENPPLIWGIYRNIPFAILGFLIAVLFFQSERRQKDRAFRWMWLTIVLSFGFYIPVVLFAEKSTWRNLQKNSWNQKNRIHFPSKDTKNKNSGTKAVVHRLNNYLYIGEFKL